MKISRILLIDDHPVFRSGLEQVIDREENLCVAGHAQSADDGLAQFESLKPDLVITDLSLETTSGLDVIKRIRRIPSNCPILVLSMHEEGLWGEQVLQHGANGYIQKNANAVDLIDAIQRTLRGEIYLSDPMQQMLLRQLSGRPAPNGQLSALSRRETEVFQYIAQGYSSEEIAESLFISVKTVQTHQANIKQKLGHASIKALRRFARSASSTVKTSELA